MYEANAPAPVIKALAGVGVFLSVCGLVWWLVLLTAGGDGAVSVASAQRSTATDPTVDDGSPAVDPPGVVPPAATTIPQPDIEPELVTLSAPTLYSDDLGTGSTEFSAVTLNEAANRLVIADDEGQLFEFDLDDAGLPILPVRRTIIIEVGDSDIEGLAWISGSTYAIAHEATGQLSVVDIGDERQVVTSQNLLRTIDTEVTETAGDGIEGVSYSETIDDVEFVVVVERPPSVRFIDDDGSPSLTVPLRVGVDDIADVWVSPGSGLWLVSDRSRVIVRIQVGADGAIRQRQQIDLVFGDGRFEQPEGLVVSHDGERLYVVGESPGPGRFSLGVWSLG